MYLNRIRDIPDGSMWTERASGRTFIIREAAQGFVLFADERGSLQPLTAEREFRARFECVYDRAALRSQFQMSLANLGVFRVLWSPSKRRIYARSESATRQFSVPDDAQEVGIYSASSDLTVKDFFLDLHGCITRTKRAAQLATAAG